MYYVWLNAVRSYFICSCCSLGTEKENVTLKLMTAKMSVVRSNWLLIGKVSTLDVFTALTDQRCLWSTKIEESHGWTCYTYHTYLKVYLIAIFWLVYLQIINFSVGQKNRKMLNTKRKRHEFVWWLSYMAANLKIH